MSEKYWRAMSDAIKRAWRDPEKRARMMAPRSNKGKPPPFAGRKHTPETREKMRRAKIGASLTGAKRCCEAREDTKAAPRRGSSAQVELPHWVPPELIEEFHKVAAARGEFAAAAHIRKLKRGARA